jgi:hypothetical protein
MPASTVFIYAYIEDADLRATHMTRDLIRRDKECVEKEAFDRLKTELRHAFAAPESSYKSLTAAEVIARNRT